MQEFLLPGKFVDSDHQEVIAFTREVVGPVDSPVEQIVKLYYAVRDRFPYTPYLDFKNPANYSASGVLEHGKGWCVSKSALLVAGARVLGVPARCGYADVANHLSTAKMRAAMAGSNIYYWHSYSDFYLNNRWIKATPAFNKALCDKAGIKPLEFDGSHDSLFHEFDKAGHRHLEYLRDRGVFADVPYAEILSTFREKYSKASFTPAEGDDFITDVKS